MINYSILRIEVKLRLNFHSNFSFEISKLRLNFHINFSVKTLTWENKIKIKGQTIKKLFASSITFQICCTFVLVVLLQLQKFINILDTKYMIWHHNINNCPNTKKQKTTNKKKTKRALLIMIIITGETTIVTLCGSDTIKPRCKWLSTLLEYLLKSFTKLVRTRSKGLDRTRDTLTHLLE